MRDTTIYTYVPTANLYEYVVIPTDLDIRKLLVQSREYQTATSTLLAEAKLSEDNDKHVPFDVTTAEWADMLLSQYPKVEQYAWWHTLNGTRPVCGAPGYFEVSVAQNISAQRAVRINLDQGHWFTKSSSTPADMGKGMIQGIAPWSCFCRPFGDPMNPEDWYKPQDIGNLRLRIKAGAAASANTLNTVALQQIYKY